MNEAQRYAELCRAANPQFPEVLLAAGHRILGKTTLPPTVLTNALSAPTSIGGRDLPP